MGAARGRFKAALTAVALAVGVSVTGWVAPASADTMTQRNATQIIADMGAGWNLGNSLEASSNGVPSETAWNNPTVTQGLIDSVHAAGFDTIRIPVSYLNYIGPGPSYTINANWLNRIQQVVDYAYDRGMHVVINMHGDGYKTIGGSWLICDASNQTTIKAKYQSAWRQIATRFKDYDERLILESMNEEFDGQYGAPTQPCYSNINAYNQIFVDTVRQTGGNNASRWLLVPGWNTNIDFTTGNYGFVIPTDTHRDPAVPSGERRIMISVHYYDPWDFAGAESGSITQWGPNATNPSKTSSWGQEDHMDRQLKKTYDAFVTKGYPVVVGEYGSINKSSHDSANPGFRQDYARTMVATAKKYGAATIYWDNGINGQYGFGLFNRTTNQVTQPGLVGAIMDGLGDVDPGGPSDTYRIKHLATGLYLDSDADGAVVLAAGSEFDDQQWIVTETSSGDYTIRNARSGRYYLDTEATGNAVVWNTGDVIADSLWTMETVASGGVRLDNQRTDRGYMYATAAGGLQWNTGTADASTVWVFEEL